MGKDVVNQDVKAQLVDVELWRRGQYRADLRGGLLVCLIGTGVGSRGGAAFAFAIAQLLGLGNNLSAQLSADARLVADG